VISRFPYSGAHELAAQVASNLGYGFFGSEIVDEIARNEGVQRELVAGLDERVTSAIERYVIDSFHHRPFAEQDYMRAATRVISALVHRGRAVILGRGAAAMVDPAHALRVLIVAPLEWRRTRLAEANGLTPHQAAALLASKDSERAEFNHRNLGFAQDDPVNYDLVVNSAALGLGLSAATIVACFRQRFRES
jgi:cytidylate kinase